MTAYELATGLENHFKNNFITSESALLLRQQADRIAELEKRKWSEQDIKNACISARLSEEDFFRIKAYLPVYSSPQTKPLSEDEIEQIAKQHLAAYAQFIGAGEVCYEGEIEFARAIEERHGIK